MTGRENIYLNGSIIGMRRDEIDEKFASIAEFADIGEFLDAPVATYSSGMKVRLGFAIAIHADPDLLVIDEVMSVGDAGFRHKANRHMQTYRQKAKAILFVSHDMSMIRQTCNRLLWLEEGRVIYNGSVSEGILRYEEMCKSAGESLDQKERQKAKNYVAIAHMQEALEVQQAGVLDGDGAPTTAVAPGAPLRIYCDLEVRRALAHLTVVAYIRDKTGDSRPLAMMRAYDEGFVMPLQQPGRYRIVVETNQHNFAPGEYLPIVEVINGKSYELYSAEHAGAPFAVRDESHNDMEYPRGYVQTAERWSARPLRA
jgi:energy-coupling factor transporter ATP-binding protein EcfA2